MRRAGGGKAKGSAFERLICKELSLWVSRGKRDDLFWRSAMSGGRATVGRAQGKDRRAHAGDISATHKDGHVLTEYWIVECKFYKDLQLEAFVLGLPCKLRKFWRQARTEGRIHGKHAMLIAKQNRGPIMVVMADDDAERYNWATAARYAQVRAGNVAVIDFRQMLMTPYNVRIRHR
jgi:hypothetical protein